MENGVPDPILEDVAVIPVVDTSLYGITVQLSLCTDTAITTAGAGGAGLYTGFATSRTDTATVDDTLVFMAVSANGLYAVGEDFK